MDNGHEPATKADLAELRAELKADFKADLAALESRMKASDEMLHAESQHRFNALEESMRDGQTELLKAFYGFAQSVELKLKDGEIAAFLARQRMTAIEIRQTEVEKRLNMPPQQ